MPVIPVTFQDLGRFVINPNDLFVTPHEIALHSCEALKKLTSIEPERILDPGCGTGRWGSVAKKVFEKQEMIVGVDIAPTATLIDYEEIVTKNFLEYQEDFLFDLVIGNPPYSSATDRNLAEKFIRKSMELLKEEGWLAFILKTEYLASLQRVELFKAFPPKYMVQYVPRIHWDGYKFSSTIEYAFYIWQKGFTGHPEIRWLNIKTGELY